MESNKLPTADYSPLLRISDLKRRGSSEEGCQLPPHSLSAGKDVKDPAYHESLGPLAKRARSCTGTNPTFDTIQKAFGDAFQYSRLSILFSTLAIPLIALVTWLASTAPEFKLFGSFTGLVIGGRFSQSTAKAIDILCSGFMAPALMTVLNVIWFGSARLAMRASRGKPQEQQRRIPLATLVTASGMSTGSYNVMDFISLRRGRMWRLYCLILLSLSSALSWTSLSNIIAYEAYTETIPSNTEYKLRALNDMEIDSTTRTSDSIIGQANVLEPQASFKFNIQQEASISEQLTNLLNQMLLSNSSSLDSEGGYVVLNATDISLVNLEPSVVALYNIPAFRLSATCQPSLLLPSSLDPVQMGEDAVQMHATLISPNSTGQMYYYWYPGVKGDIKSGYTSELPFVLFSLDYQHAVLGYMHTHNWNNSVLTQYGEIKPVVLNLTSILSTVTTYSLHCSLLRQEGLVNYTRTAGQTGRVSESQFQPYKSPQRSFIGDWQVVLNYHATTETGTIPGIAPAFSGGLACAVGDGQLATCPSINFSTLASNFVLASGRAQSILFNVAAMNSSRDRPEYFYNVTGATMQQFYHITYVPALLLASLLSLTIAASTAVGMTVYARHIQRDSMRELHEATTLRLVVNSGAGILQDTASMARLANLSDNQLQEAAKEVYIIMY
ncbi:hypothetical protein ACSS6W_002579 [Trichoderma asperelloides]